MNQSGFKDQRQTLIIESVVELTQAQLDSVVSAVGADPKKINTINKKNPNLVAGLRISYQGKVLDLSFQNKLNLIKEEA